MVNNKKPKWAGLFNDNSYRIGNIIMVECPECKTMEDSDYVDKHGKCYNCVARDRELSGD